MRLSLHCFWLVAWMFLLGVPGCGGSETKDAKDIVKEIEPVETARGRKEKMAVGKEEPMPLPRMPRR
jgi:hypothetical protein